MKRKTLVKRIATTGLAAAMALSMSLPVFAMEGDGTLVSNDNSAKINKTLTMAENGVSVPEATFNFSVTSTDSGAPEVSNVTIKASDAMKNKSAATDAIFGKVDLTNTVPGQYTYTVKETEVTEANWKDPDTESSGDNHVLTTDKAEYKVVIRVENGTAGKTITGITAQKKKADGTYGDKQSTIDFTNKYTEYANDDPTPNPNPDEPETPGDSSKGLVISKRITGTGADTTKKFTYSIEFTEDKANSGLATTVTNAGKKLYTNEDCTTEAASIVAGTTYYFQLGNNDEIDIKLPAGNSYTVKELNANPYTASTNVVTNGEKDTKQTGADVTATVGEKSNTVAYTNDLGASPLTGIVNNYGGLIAVVAIAAGGMVVLTLRRRREDV